LSGENESALVLPEKPLSKAIYILRRGLNASVLNSIIKRMTLLLFFTFLSGIVTIFAPCIWPILPIVLSASVSGGKKKPLGLVTGLAVSFIFFTLTLAAIVKVIPFDPEALRYLAVVIIGFLGLVLIVPWLGDRLEVAVSKLSGIGGRFTHGRGDGFGGGFITGVALGLIWTPCAGPILAAVATVAATQAVGYQAFLLIVTYVIGVCVPLYILTLIGGRVLTGTRAFSAYTGIIQKVFGVVMILSALMIFTGYDRKLQTTILEKFPSYGSFLKVFENQAEKTGQLEVLRTGKENMKDVQSGILDSMFQPNLQNLGPAPELTGINGWLNSDPLTMKSLRGKVVLVDFWTYSCINCIRTLPYVTSWYEKYKDQGLVVIGVHTPEFAFEHKKENVAEALKKYKITYPVAQDNDYATWQAYSNRYWPAHYLIDAQGNIRETHFGEGGYEETEMAIQALLKEAGAEITDTEVTKEMGDVSAGPKTPETYLGSGRAENLRSPEVVTGALQSFTQPSTLPLHGYAFEGQVQVGAEQALMKTESALTLSFQGSKVFLVMRPGITGAVSKVKILLDGAPIAQSVSGKDVRNGEVVIDGDHLYELIDFQGENKKAIIKIITEEGDTEVYAFTFA
jgi:cytochrome c biogenesis protein CcdA/thiol-disulfide isomerase/thioredoxin